LEQYHEKAISVDVFRNESEKIDRKAQEYNTEIARLQSELERLMVAGSEPAEAQKNLFVS